MSDSLSNLTNFQERWPLQVKNGSGSAIPGCSVVLITSAALVNGRIVYTVRQPNAASTDFNWNGYLVTWPVTIGANSTDTGWASDLVIPNYVRYDSGTPAIKEVWGPKHSQLTLSKNYYGFEILGSNTTVNSNNVTLARWVGSPIVIGKIDDGSVTLGGTCTVSVQVGTTYQTDSTMNITGVVNRGKALTSLSTPYCGVSEGNGIPVLMWVAC